MNSEELEQSLRTEFESYLKNVTADMRQEVSEFQKKVEAEFEKHKSQMDEVFQDFYGRFAADKQIDEAFKDAVVEHLRLARDEGARITATAIAEAEELQKEEAAAAADSSTVVSEIRNAIQDISSKTTQSAILKSLVAHASKFTPRGAFFIIKNEHLVGWRVFGSEVETDDKAVREVFFPISNETLLSQSVNELKTVEGVYGTCPDDSIYLNRLHFGQPDRMYAIPLVVRERAVAVLYADYGTQGARVNVEALETLVHVAGLTVEISASARAVKASPETAEQSAGVQSFDEAEHHIEEKTETPTAFAESFETAPIVAPAFAETVAEPAFSYESSYEFPPPTEGTEESFSPVTVEEPVENDYQPIESDSFAVAPIADNAASYRPEEVLPAETETFAPQEYQTLTKDEPQFESEPLWSEPVSTEDYYSSDSAASFKAPSFETFQAPSFEEVPEMPVVESSFTAPAAAEYEFESAPVVTALPIEFEPPVQTFEAPSFETTPAYEAEDYSSVKESAFNMENGQAENFVGAKPVETVSETVAPTTSARTRLSERNVDLPIEVSDDERRLHNDARRFARLLVSEIKLYNEQKVKEGREGSDLYERLREAIDRSREMYDKRVQPPVAAKFDYFHYELVSNLAEGDQNKLGRSYPGTNS